MRRIGIICLLWLGLAALFSPSHAQRPDTAPYALPGSYTPGTREFTVNGERPLSVTVWYPALNPEGAEVVADYRLGLFGLPGNALRDAEPDMSGAPYPLVVFSHGWGLSRLLYTDLMEHIASHGFVVIAVEHPGSTILDAALGTTKMQEDTPALFIHRPDDLLTALDYAEILTAKDGDLPGLIDLERVAVMGHSFGGYTALSVAGSRLDFSALRTWCDQYAGSPLDAHPDVAVYPPDSRDFDGTAGACFLLPHETQLAELRGLESVPEGLWPSVMDARVDVVVALAPWAGPLFGVDGLGALTMPALVIVGSADQVTIPERDAYPIYNKLGSADKSLFVLENANHFIYLDTCAPVLQQLGQSFVCSDEVWDMERAHDLVFHTVTAFLRAELYDDWDAKAALSAENMNFAETRFESSR